MMEMIKKAEGKNEAKTPLIIGDQDEKKEDKMQTTKSSAPTKTNVEPERKDDWEEDDIDRL